MVRFRQQKANGISDWAFFFFPCVTYKLRSAEAPIVVHLRKLKCCAEIHDRNSRQKANTEKQKLERPGVLNGDVGQSLHRYGKA